MKKYGILLSAEEHKRLKRLAADEGGTMQDIARDAVLAAIGKGDRPDIRATGPPADAANLRRAAATARQLAEQLESLAGNGEEQQTTISMPIEALISIFRKAQNETDTSPVEAAKAIVDQIDREFGAPNRNAAADSGGATPTPRRKRSAAG